MNSALIKRLRKIATLEAEDYGAEPQDHSSWQAADVIERQAAQIEMMREGFTNIMVNTCEKFPGQRTLQIMEICNKSLSATPDQALEQFAAKVREQCAQMLLNGSFLHDQAPDKLLAAEAAKAIRAITELPK